ncbi:hypothetical protein EB118_12260, partial [bacterium]|nr:hypothetical protein [bacterium]
EPFYLYIDWGGNPKKVEITSQSSNNLGVRCLDPERLKQQTKKLLLNFPNANEIEYVYQDVQDTKDHKKPKGKPKLKKK